jgi:hypothetical protein
MKEIVVLIRLLGVVAMISCGTGWRIEGDLITETPDEHYQAQESLGRLMFLTNQKAVLLPG